MAGASVAARHFPFQVGRSAAAQLALEEPGVWDRHFELTLEPGTGIRLQAHPDALVSVNGQAVREILLRNGDVIEFGALKIRFWLGETTPNPMALRETMVWVSLAALFLVQVGIIYWLCRSDF